MEISNEEAELLIDREPLPHHMAMLTMLASCASPKLAPMHAAR